MAKTTSGFGDLSKYQYDLPNIFKTIKKVAVILVITGTFRADRKINDQTRKEPFLFFEKSNKIVITILANDDSASL